MIRVLHLVDRFYRFGGGELFFRDWLHHLDPRIEFVCSLVVGDMESYQGFPIPVYKLSDVDIEKLKSQADLLLWWGRVGDVIDQFLDLERVMFAHSSYNVDWFLHYAAARTEYAIAVSAEAKARIGFRKCWVVYPGISPELCGYGEVSGSSVRTLLGFSKDDFVVGQFGRLTDFKNVEMTVRGIAQTKAKLLLIGDGPSLQSVTELCDNFIPGRCRHIHYIDGDRIGSFYDAVDAVCLSSLGEGCPRVMWEAMRFAKPFITTPVGAIPEIVEDGKTGLIVRDENDIARAINEVWSNESLRRRLSDSSYNKFLEDGSVERTSKEIADIFQTIVGRRMLL